MDATMDLPQLLKIGKGEKLSEPVNHCHNNE